MRFFLGERLFCQVLLWPCLYICIVRDITRARCLSSNFGIGQDVFGIGQAIDIYASPPSWFGIAEVARVYTGFVSLQGLVVARFLMLGATIDVAALLAF